MKPEDLAELVSGIVKRYIFDQLQPLQEGVADLSRQLATLEARCGVSEGEAVRQYSELSEAVSGLTKGLGKLEEVAASHIAEANTYHRSLSDQINELVRGQEASDQKMAETVETAIKAQAEKTEVYMLELAGKLRTCNVRVDEAAAFASEAASKYNEAALVVGGLPDFVSKTVAEAIAQVKVEPGEVIHGRDALQLEILPHIDQMKSYPRGCYAHHAGGLWRSFEATSGMRGWECIVNGIDVIEIDHDGERQITVKAKTSAGEAVVKQIVVPNVIYRGVFRKEAEYAKNDATTYGGSLWIRLVDGPGGVPGSGDGTWQLAVKKGNDAIAPVKVKKAGG